MNITGGTYTIAAANSELAVLPMTGRILREYWTNYTGNFTQLVASDPAFAARPDGSDYLPGFASTPLKPKLRFGERLRGYEQPPVTGLYRFAVTRVHVEAALHLSRTDQPRDVVQVAWSHPDRAGPGLDTVTPLPLQAGRKDYIETVHESDGGDAQLTVMWQAPGREPEILPGEFLSPFPAPAKKGRR